MFQRAKPIFLEGLNATRDVQAGFVLPFHMEASARVQLRCAAATFYRAHLNREMIAHGPARAAHGMARVDEIELSVRPGVNHVAIEVAGYNAENYYTTGDASFLQAEIVFEGNVVAATDAGCAGVHLTQRRPAERFSHARCAGEVYALDAAFFDWRVGKIAEPHATAALDGPRALLARDVPLPELTVHDRPTVMGVRTMVVDDARIVRRMAALETDAYIESIAKLGERPASENARERGIGLRGDVRTSDGEMRFFNVVGAAAIELDFLELNSGFLSIDVETNAAATIDVCFVDHLDDSGEIDPRIGDMNGAIRLHVPGGRVRFVAFEPHCLRYARVVVRGVDAFTLHGVAVIDYAYPDRAGGTFACSDDALERIYQAARLTLRLNTLDVFMDCPGRERAGWLCDSLFSGRAMQVFWGDASVERAMLENFLHAPQDLESAPGLFPECYPAKRNRGGNFIPNWSMFLAIELCEYVRRTDDRAFGEAYRVRIGQLVEGLRTCENAHGLLGERLPGYWFIDWSRANEDEFKKPISTATNALYASMLDALARQYERNDWSDRARRVRSTIRKIVRADGHLADALRVDGDALSIGERTSEAAQYYHFWSGLLDATGDHAATWRALVERAGPLVDDASRDAALAPSNVFIGLYLRLETLAQTGQIERLIEEMRKLFLPMLARGPGTLWENLKPDGSVCHGFASHAAVWLVRDVLGIGLPDAIEKTIRIAPRPAGLTWARGTMPVGDGIASVEWHAAADAFRLIASVPAGYAGVFALPAEIIDGRRVHVNGEARDVSVDGLRFERAIEIVARVSKP